MGEGKHVRFTVASGAGRASAVAFGRARLPDGHEDGLDAAFALEVNRWNGAEEARLVLRAAALPQTAPIVRWGRAGDSWLAEALGELDAPLAPDVRRRRRTVRRSSATAAAAASPRRSPGSSRAASRCSSSPPARSAARATCEGRLGGFALCSWDELERAADRADEFAHVVALDPPVLAAHERALQVAARGRTAHLAWGAPELRFTEDVLAHDVVSRSALTALYASLRDAPGASLEDVLRGPEHAERRAVARRAPAARPRRARPRRRSTAATRRVEPAAAASAPISSARRPTAPTTLRLQEARRWLSRASARAA